MADSTTKSVVLSVGAVFFILWLLNKYKKKAPIAIPLFVQENNITILPSTGEYDVLDTDNNLILNREDSSKHTTVTLVFPTKKTNSSMNLSNGKTIWIYNLSNGNLIYVKDNGAVANVNPSELSNAQANSTTLVANLMSFDSAKAVYDSTADKWYYINSSNGY